MAALSNVAKFARKWEKAYLEDMAALGVKDPDVLTRVTAQKGPRIAAYKCLYIA